MNDKWNFRTYFLGYVLFQIFINSKIEQSNSVSIFFLGCLDNCLRFLILKSKSIYKNNRLMFFDKMIVFFLWRTFPTTLWHQFIELTFLNELFGDIQSSDKFPVDENLRECRPTRVLPRPIPHLLVLDDVVKSILYFVVFENLEQTSSKSTFWVFRCSFDKYNERTALYHVFHFGMPHNFVLFKLYFMLICNFCQ
jgi:hypothetical protein